MIERVDHLVYGVPSVEAAVEALEARLGVRASPGGRHVEEATRNALVGLGPGCYLEIVGPDPEAPAPAWERWFGLDRLEAPRLVAWAAKGNRLEELVLAARRSGVTLGAVRRGCRERPDGSRLSWTLTDPRVSVADALAPFFIDWDSSPHPADTAAPGCRLLELRAEHPAPARVLETLRALALPLRVDPGPRPALIAQIQTPTGTVELR